MPKRDDDDKFEFIPVDEDIAEWMKDPEFAKAVKARYAELQREMKAEEVHATRKKRRGALKAFTAKVRDFWSSISRGIATRGGDGGVL